MQINCDGVVHNPLGGASYAETFAELTEHVSKAEKTII